MRINWNRNLESLNSCRQFTQFNINQEHKQCQRYLSFEITSNFHAICIKTKNTLNVSPCCENAIVWMTHFPCTLHCTDMAIHFHEQRSSYQSRRFFCGCSSSKDESLFHYVMHTVQKSSNSSLYFWFKNIYIYIHTG